MSVRTAESAPLTEKAALMDLVTWAEKWPAWQRNALRRQVIDETLDDQAIELQGETA